MELVQCWCGRRTETRTMTETSIADNAHTVVRVCPQHGQFWSEQDRPESEA